jgi:hypothetical protein
MAEAAFPLLGTAFVLLVVLPIGALVAKGLLALAERSELGGALGGLNLRYLLLTGSSLLPLAWFFSAGLHQAETGKTALACVFDHEQAGRCFEPFFFSALLGVGVLMASFKMLARSEFVSESASRGAHEQAKRIQRLVADCLELQDLGGRIFVTDSEGFTLGVQGLLRPRVFVGAAFAASLTDTMLASALGHEQEHVRSFDPLRYWLLELALAVNPGGRGLLAPHLARWKAAREAHCDRNAVLGGAAPLSLAEAIVRAARPLPTEAVALGTTDTAVLRLRIQLLLAFAERAPQRRPGQVLSVGPLGFALLFSVLLLPHQTNTVPLDVLHSSAERTLTYLWH